MCVCVVNSFGRGEGEMAQKKLGGGRNREKSREEGENVR